MRPHREGEGAGSPIGAEDSPARTNPDETPRIEAAGARGSLSREVKAKEGEGGGGKAEEARQNWGGGGGGGGGGERLPVVVVDIGNTRQDAAPAPAPGFHARQLDEQPRPPRDAASKGRGGKPLLHTAAPIRRAGRCLPPRTALDDALGLARGVSCHESLANKDLREPKLQHAAYHTAGLPRAEIVCSYTL